MLLSLKWLRNYLDLGDVSPLELAKKITLAGIEVETITKVSEATNCFVGEVIECIKHPEADKLRICRVNLGDCTEQIVCGAPNVAIGQKVVVARVGAVLPGNIKIKKAKLRGTESNGMICSLKELGIENKLVPQEFQSGIVVLDNTAPVGMDALEYLGFDDYVLELSLTPNRSDCLSIYGLAYEIGAIFDKVIKLPIEEVPYSLDSDFKVTITSDDCHLYYAKKISNVKISRSPQWLQAILITNGIRPINNVVDITNFVMLELGQPLHAFDLNKVGTKEILVRNAKAGEEIVTLDGITRKLLPTDLVITNGQEPIALAGVMGGENTEIDDKTTDVLLESAVFKPLTIRNTYTRLGLRSEASVRYEKQVDPARTLLALNRACSLLVSLAEGTIDNKLQFARTYKVDDNLVNISLDKINSVLGIKLQESVVEDILRRLKFSYVRLKGGFVVTVPSRRPDITIPEDLIEEIIRIYGYEHLASTTPETNTMGELSPRQKKQKTIRKTLLGSGFNEVLTYSLINEKNLDKFTHFSDSGDVIRLALPMSEERGVLRMGLIHSLLEVVSHNLARNIDDIAIFEIGKRYFLKENSPVEKLILSGAASGKVTQSKWQGIANSLDFYHIKGVLENVFERLNIASLINFEQNENCSADFHPYKTANILFNGEVIGIIGSVHPNTQKAYDLNETYVFELDLEEILSFDLAEPRFSTISKYPNVTRDIAIVVDSETKAGELIKEIRSKGKNILKSVEVFDVYQGEHVEAGKKSIAFSLTFENVEKTLTDDEVTKVYNQIISYLENTFSAKLRK